MMDVLISDSKLRSDRDLTVINLQVFGGSAQKMWTKVHTEHVVWRRIPLPPMHRQTSRNNGDRSRFQNSFKALSTDPGRYLQRRSQLNHDGMIVKRRHGPFGHRLAHLKCKYVLPSK